MQAGKAEFPSCDEPECMKNPRPKTRSEAAAPQATRHLTPGQKRALDHQADAEHADGTERETLTRKMKQAGEDDAQSET